MTTILSPADAPKFELSKLYQQRWHVELDLRNIKTTLGMETLVCMTPQMNEKEMWVYFLAYNLIRLLMCEAALQAEILPRQIAASSIRSKSGSLGAATLGEIQAANKTFCYSY